MVYYSTLFISLVLTLATIPPLTKLAVHLHLLDEPDKRKTHSIPVPRCGGLAMALGALTPTAYWFIDDRFILSFLCAASIIVLFGIADDFLGLSPKWKLVGQISASLIVVVWGGVRIENLGALMPAGVLLPVWVATPLTLLTLVGVTNAVNLVDGLDGLAGGVSLLNICFVGYLAVIVGNVAVAVTCLAIAGAIFAFLRFNTHPASIFMGDSGSQFLGFAAIVFALVVSQQSDAISPLVPLLLFGLPVLDTLTVMTTRFLSGRSPFSPDRSHFHHKLLEVGLGHAEAVVAIYILQSFLVVLAYFLRYQSAWLIVLVYACFVAALLSFFYFARKFKGNQDRWQPIERLKLWCAEVRGKRQLLAVLFPFFTYYFYVLALPWVVFVSPPSVIGAYASICVACCFLLLVWLNPRLAERLLRVLFFLVIPLVIFSGDPAWLGVAGKDGDTVLNVGFVLLFFCSILVSFFSTRQKGIWSTPLDFLVLLLLLCLPNIAGISFHHQRLGIIGLKCLVLIVCFEVLLSERRGKCQGLVLAMVGALVVYGVRGFV